MMAWCGGRDRKAGGDGAGQSGDVEAKVGRALDVNVGTGVGGSAGPARNIVLCHT